MVTPVFATTSTIASSVDPIANRLRGRILLQVEAKGEAWYINPINGQRYFLGRPDDAVQVMRQTGLGISNKDFDNFGGKAPQRLAGRILLKVEGHGEAYYVNPNGYTLHYLSPADAWALMRTFGLGISNIDIGKIAVSSSTQPRLNNQSSVGSITETSRISHPQQSHSLQPTH